MNALFITFLMSSVSMSVVIVLMLALGIWSAGKIPAAVRYYTWLIVLVGLLIPFRPNIAMPFEPLMISPFQGLADMQGAAQKDAPAVTGESAARQESPEAGFVQGSEAGFVQGSEAGFVQGSEAGFVQGSEAGSVQGSEAGSVQGSEAGSVQGSEAGSVAAADASAAGAAGAGLFPVRPATYAWIVYGIWIAGAVFFLGMHFRAYGKFRSAVRRWGAEPKDAGVYETLKSVQNAMGLDRNQITVKECMFVESPMMIGLLKPVVLLPDKAISADELDHIFRHELTHYRRADVLINFLILLARAIHWFNPLVHLMAKAVRADCEAACDEKVIGGGDSDTRRQYGETIIGFVGTKNARSPVLSTYFYGGSNSMKKRLTSIMDTGKKNKWLAVVMVLAVAVAAVLASAALTAPNSAAEPIGEAKARSIALQHAGVTEANAFFVRVYLDYEQGKAVYNVEFYSGNTEYDYEIDAANGQIREMDKDIEHYAITSQAALGSAAAKQYMDEAKARAMTASLAGITAGQVSGGAGKNVSGSSAAPASSGSNTDIGEAKAKSLALSAAGLTESQIYHLEISFDYEHGKAVYEVDFKSGGMEYEYEIDAASGAILKSDAEHDD